MSLAVVGALGLWIAGGIRPRPDERQGHLAPQLLLLRRACRLRLWRREGDLRRGGHRSDPPRGRRIGPGGAVHRGGHRPLWLRGRHHHGQARVQGPAREDDRQLRADEPHVDHLLRGQGHQGTQGPGGQEGLVHRRRLAAPGLPRPPQAQQRGQGEGPGSPARPRGEADRRHDGHRGRPGRLSTRPRRAPSSARRARKSPISVTPTTASMP